MNNLQPLRYLIILLSGDVDAAWKTNIKDGGMSEWMRSGSLPTRHTLPYVTAKGLSCETKMQLAVPREWLNNEREDALAFIIGWGWKISRTSSIKLHLCINKLESRHCRLQKSFSRVFLKIKSLAYVVV